MNFKNINLLNLILKWFKLLLAIQVVVFIMAFVFTSSTFMKPKFKSWAVVYPANTKSYSDESPSEQMVQVFNATEIRESIIQKFHLMEHYNIEPDQKRAQGKLNLMYQRNVLVSKTLADAVRIEVHDTDPEIAKQMVNAILDAYELKVKTLQERRYGEKVGRWNRAIERKIVVIDSLKTELQKLAIRDGLMDYETQVVEVMKGYLGTADGGLANVDKKRVGELKARMDDKGGDLIVVMDRLKEENILLSDLVAEHDEALADYDAQETYIDVIESAYVTDKTSGPARWILVLGSMLFAAFLSLTFLAVFDRVELKK